eukprot:gene45594-22390_t
MAGNAILPAGLSPEITEALRLMQGDPGKMAQLASALAASTPVPEAA